MTSGPVGALDDLQVVALVVDDQRGVFGHAASPCPVAPARRRTARLVDRLIAAYRTCERASSMRPRLSSRPSAASALARSGARRAAGQNAAQGRAELAEADALGFGEVAAAASASAAGVPVGVSASSGTPAAPAARGSPRRAGRGPCRPASIGRAFSAKTVRSASSRMVLAPSLTSGMARARRLARVARQRARSRLAAPPATSRPGARRRPGGCSGC